MRPERYLPLPGALSPPKWSSRYSKLSEVKPCTNKSRPSQACCPRSHCFQFDSYGIIITRGSSCNRYVSAGEQVRKQRLCHVLGPEPQAVISYWTSIPVLPSSWNRHWGMMAMVACQTARISIFGTVLLMNLKESAILDWALSNLSDSHKILSTFALRDISTIVVRVTQSQDFRWLEIGRDHVAWTVDYGLRNFIER